MLSRKSKTLKIISMLLIGAALSTSLICCGSNAATSTSETAAKEETETKDAKEEEKSSEEKSPETNNDQASKESTDAAPTSETAPAENTSEPAETADASASQGEEEIEDINHIRQAPEGKVYIFKNNGKYHSRSKCNGIYGGKLVDKNIAEAAGYSKCPNCNKN